MENQYHLKPKARQVTINFLPIQLFALDHLKSYFAVNQRGKEFADGCDQNRQRIVGQSDRNHGSTQIRQKRRKKSRRKKERAQPLGVLGCHRRKPLCQHWQHCKVLNLAVRCAQVHIYAKPHNINVSTIPFFPQTNQPPFSTLWPQTGRALQWIASCALA